MSVHVLVPLTHCTFPHVSRADLVHCPWYPKSSCYVSESACVTATCPKFPEAVCFVVPCSCATLFVDKRGLVVNCRRNDTTTTSTTTTTSPTDASTTESSRKPDVITPFGPDDDDQEREMEMECECFSCAYVLKSIGKVCTAGLGEMARQLLELRVSVGGNCLCCGWGVCASQMGIGGAAAYWRLLGGVSED